MLWVVSLIGRLVVYQLDVLECLQKTHDRVCGFQVSELLWFVEQISNPYFKGVMVTEREAKGNTHAQGKPSDLR